MPLVGGKLQRVIVEYPDLVERVNEKFRVVGVARIRVKNRPPRILALAGPEHIHENRVLIQIGATAIGDMSERREEGLQRGRRRGQPHHSGRPAIDLVRFEGALQVAEELQRRAGSWSSQINAVK